MEPADCSVLKPIGDEARPSSWLAERWLRPERMDDPNLDGNLHIQALRGLSRLNKVGNSARLIWPQLRQIARSLGKPLRVLDIATGAGDVPLALARIARRQQMRIDFAGCDISSRAVEHAQSQAAFDGNCVTFFRYDVLAQPLPTGYDVLICSLFLHHLQREQVVDLLERMGAAAGSGIVVSDLVRTRATWLMTYAASRLVTRSEVVHADGVMSVEAAFNLAEARQLALDAGLTDCTIRSAWPCRFLLTWKNAQAAER